MGMPSRVVSICSLYCYGLALAASFQIADVWSLKHTVILHEDHSNIINKKSHISNMSGLFLLPPVANEQL